MTKSGGYLLNGLTRKNPVQMASGDPKMASSITSVDKDAMRASTAASPKTLGGRTA